MAELIVIEELMDYLIAQGVAQDKNTAVFTSVPSIWLDPRDGAPLPRDGEGAVITLRETLTIPPSSLEEWMMRTTVDVIVRARTARPGRLIQRQIHNLLVPYADSSGGRKQFTIGALLVERCWEWRGDQPLPQRQSIGETDPHRTYDRVASYMFDVRRKILAGLTLP